MEKMSRAERARQFMPFAALKGYDVLIKQKERIISDRRELTEDMAAELSGTFAKIKKGDLIKITYYDTDAYCTLTGAVTAIDLTLKYITVIKTKIAFADIFAAEKVET